VRFLLTFFGLFTPLACILWLVAGDAPPDPTLEPAPSPSREDAVLDTDGLPQVPLSGEIQRLENALLQIFHPEKNHVLYYVSFEGVEKAGGKSRIVGIRCAAFGDPVDGRENILARMEAPYLEGDPAALLAATAGEARRLVLGGGVRVFDGLGRLAAEVPSVTVDLDKKTVSTESEVWFRYPERGAELRGTGLVSDLSFTRATLRSRVHARLPVRDGAEEAVTLTCDGAATLVHGGTDDVAVVTFEKSARLEHPDFSGVCGRITARFAKSDEGERGVERVVLEENVTFELDPTRARGIEELRADRITVTGRDLVEIEGEPVRAVVRELPPEDDGARDRGPLRLFGYADRTLDVETPHVRIEFEEDGEERRISSVKFERGILVRDREGPGRLDAPWLSYDALGGRLDARGGVVASVVGRLLEAERIEVRRPPKRKDVVIVGVFGKKRLRVRATGRLGPLARGDENEYTFLCDGPLHLERLGERVLVRAEERVRVLGREEALVRAGSVLAVFEGNAVRRVEARGAIEAKDPSTGATARCDRLDFTSDRDHEILLRGEPAALAHEGRTFRGAAIRYAESGRFRASGGVVSEFALKGKRWKFLANECSGLATAGAEGAPDSFHAEGHVVVEGPDGERLEAREVDYEKESGALVLKGAPARIRKGGAFSFVGQELRLTLVEKKGGFDVAAAKTDGPAKLVVSPARGESKSARVARWEVDLNGVARLEGDVATMPEGAALRGYGEEGALLLRGSAGRTTIRIDRGEKGEIVPRKLACGDGVELDLFKGPRRDKRIEAAGLSYVVNTRAVDLRGPGKVWFRDAKEPARFREATAELTDEGIELQYVGGLETAPK